MPLRAPRPDAARIDHLISFTRVTPASAPHSACQAWRILATFGRATARSNRKSYSALALALRARGAHHKAHHIQTWSTTSSGNGARRGWQRDPSPFHLAAAAIKHATPTHPCFAALLAPPVHLQARTPRPKRMPVQRDGIIFCLLSPPSVDLALSDLRCAQVQVPTAPPASTQRTRARSLHAGLGAPLRPALDNAGS